MQAVHRTPASPGPDLHPQWQAYCFTTARRVERGLHIATIMSPSAASKRVCALAVPYVLLVNAKRRSGRECDNRQQGIWSGAGGL